MVTTDDPRTARVIALFEGLSPADLARLGEFYAPDARFKDPFNEVQGLPAIRAVFDHMYVALHEPRFVVREAIDAKQCTRDVGGELGTRAAAAWVRERLAAELG